MGKHEDKSQKRCRRCHGRGRVKKLVWKSGKNKEYYFFPCDRCGGTGYVKK